MILILKENVSKEKRENCLIHTVTQSVHKQQTNFSKNGLNNFYRIIKISFLQLDF